jgi:hypothetical protein
VAVTRTDAVADLHQAGFGTGPLWFRTGAFSATTITWANSHQYDQGLHLGAAA